jgi:hypothetical protein
MTTIHEQDFEAGAVQTGAYFEASPSLVLDAALAVGFGPDAPDVLLLSGFTKNLGHP